MRIKIVILFLAFCNSFPSHLLYAQSKVNPINQRINGAYLKKYLDDHPRANVVYAHNDVSGQPVYMGLYDMDKLVNPSEVSPDNYAGLFVGIKELFMDPLNLNIVEEYKLVEDSRGRKSLLSLLEKNNSDVLIYVSFQREYVEIAPDDKSFKSLSLLDIKGFKHTLSVNSKVYFRHRLENEEIAFRHTGFDMGLGEAPEVDLEDSGISELIGASSSGLGSLIAGDVNREYSVMDTTRNEEVDEEGWIDVMLSNLAESDIKNKLSALTQKFTSNLNVENYIAGVVTNASSYDQEGTLTAKFAEPKFKKGEGFLGKLVELNEAATGLNSMVALIKRDAKSGLSMVALIKGDDEFTPWITETEHIRIIGRARILPKKRINDYEGKVKVRKLQDGYKTPDIAKAILINSEDEEWLLIQTGSSKGSSEVISFFTGDSSNPDEWLEKRKENIRRTAELERQKAEERAELERQRAELERKKAEEKAELERKKRQYEERYNTFLLQSPSYSYSVEKSPFLFPTTVIEEKIPLAKAPKNEKKSIIARIQRMKNNGTKIGVIFALKESYVEIEDPDSTVNDKPVIKKEEWNKLSNAFYDLGNRLVNQLNEKFGTDVFQLINILNIPLKQITVLGQSIERPAFEKTQFPVVVSYSINAFKNSNGEQKLRSQIIPVEFYDGLKMTSLVSGLSSERILAYLNIDGDYSDGIEELKRQEDAAIEAYVEDMKKYHAKKVK